MKKKIYIMTSLVLAVFSENNMSHMVTLNENGIIYIAKKSNEQCIIIEKINSTEKMTLAKFFNVPLINLFTDKHNLYLSFYSAGCANLLRISKKEYSDPTIINLPIRASSSFYNFEFKMKNEKIYSTIVGDINDPFIKSQTNFLDYVYDVEKELWIPLDNTQALIYIEAKSAIKDWFYNGKLKRWYPKQNNLEIVDNSIWINSIPSQNLIKALESLKVKKFNGEEVDYFAEFTKVFTREKERNLFLKSINIENSKEMKNENTSNNENDVKKIVETENPKSKIVIILAILLTIIFSGFLIKKRKKKKIIKDKNI